MVRFSGSLKTRRFSNYTILEMIQSYLVEVVKSRRTSNYNYFWWRTIFGGEQLKKLLQQKWINYLLNFELLIFNIENLRSSFNPTNFANYESHLERLIIIKEKFRKKELKRKKKTQGDVLYCKTFTFLVRCNSFLFIFFPFFNNGK